MSNEMPEKIGEYEIVDEIGRGSLSTVYKAVQTSLNREVAIKVLPKDRLKSPDWVERFQREAQSVSMLNHPNVVQIIDQNEEGDSLYFVMEYVEGSSLAQILSQRRISLPEALKVFKDVCKGLAYAHGQNVVHRDLNPRNILVSPDLSVVKLVDFGISRVELMPSGKETVATMAAGTGTIQYIAPEQMADPGNADSRGDIYSIGVLLYEMLTGRVPIGTFNLPSRVKGDIPPEIDPLVLKCLETDAGKRYNSVGQIVKEVERLEEQLRFRLVNELKGISRSTSDMFKRSKRTITKVTWPVAAALIAVVALGAFGLYWVGSGTPETAQGAGPEGQTASLQQPASEAEPEETSPDDSPPTPRSEKPPVGRTPESASVTPPASSAATSSTPATPQPVSTPAPDRPAVDSEAVSTPPRPANRLARSIEVAADKHEAGLSDQALSDIDVLVQRNSAHPGLIDAYLLKAQILEDKARNDAAMGTYVEIESRFPGHPRTAEAKYRRAQLLMKDRNKESQLAARSLLGGVAEGFPGSSWAPKALASKAQIEMTRKLKESDPVLGKKVPSALITYRVLVEKYPNDSSSEWGLWRLGDLYEDIKSYQMAAETYSRLGERFPNTRLDAWWKAGRIFDRELKDNGSALNAYQKVGQESRRYKDAQKRIQKLGR